MRLHNVTPERKTPVGAAFRGLSKGSPKNDCLMFELTLGSQSHWDYDPIDHGNHCASITHDSE